MAQGGIQMIPLTIKARLGTEGTHAERGIFTFSFNELDGDVVQFLEGLATVRSVARILFPLCVQE